MARRREFRRCDCYDECPEPETYSVRCRLCWSVDVERAESSTSESHDELDLTDEERLL